MSSSKSRVRPVRSIGSIGSGLDGGSVLRGKRADQLRLEGADGHEYVLRSIDKDPSRTVPENLQGSIATDIVQDQIAAIHPYGAFIVPKLDLISIHGRSRAPRPHRARPICAVDMEHLSRAQPVQDLDAGSVVAETPTPGAWLGLALDGKGERMCPSGSFAAVFDGVSSSVQSGLHRFTKLHLDLLESIVREGAERGQFVEVIENLADAVWFVHAASNRQRHPRRSSHA